MAARALLSRSASPDPHLRLSVEPPGRRGSPLDHRDAFPFLTGPQRLPSQPADRYGAVLPMRHERPALRLLAAPSGRSPMPAVCTWDCRARVATRPRRESECTGAEESCERCRLAPLARRYQTDRGRGALRASGDRNASPARSFRRLQHEQSQPPLGTVPKRAHRRRRSPHRAEMPGGHGHFSRR